MTPDFSIQGGEWASAYSGDPPGSITPAVDAAVSLVQGIPLGPSEKGDMYPIPDRPRVVTILGSRGTGKSTVLYFTAHRLGAEDPNCLVVPIVDPEAFAPGDSLGSWVLAHLDRTLSDRERGHEPQYGGKRTMGQLLEDLRRAQSVRAGDYLSGLGQRGLNFDDFARDAVKIPAHGVRMAQRVAGFLDGLAEVRGQEDLRLVIPVDDADLFPEILPSIVSDAQLLGASRRVTVIFAADLKTLNQSLQVSYLSNHGQGVSLALANELMRPQDVRELAGRRLVKHFPRSLRVLLPALSLEQRLSFCPLGSTPKVSMDALLREFKTEDSSDRSLADLFEIRSVSGTRLTASPYAKALSENARDLRQLHEALSNVDPSQENATSHAMGLLLRHGLDGLDHDLPEKASSAISISEENGERPVASFNFHGISFGKGVTGGSLLYSRRSDQDSPVADLSGDEDRPPLSQSVTARMLERDYSHLEHPGKESSEEPPGTEEALEARFEAIRDRELPEQYTHLVHLAWEAVQNGRSSILKLGGWTTRPGSSGGKNWDGFLLGYPSSSAWNYWSVPIWESYSDFYTYLGGWSRFIETDLQRGRVHPGHTTVSLALLVHLDLIATTQTHRAVPEWIATLTRDRLVEMIEAWDNGDRQLQAEVGERLDAAFVEAKGGRAERARDFVAWFSFELPLSACPTLTPTGVGRWLTEFWKERTSDDAIRHECAKRIYELGNEHLTSYRADGDLALLRAVEPLDPESGRQIRTERLSALREELRDQAAARQSQILNQLESNEIDDRLVAGLKAQGASSDILSSLYRAGVSPQAISTIADAFPVLQQPLAVEPRDEPGNLVDDSPN